MAHENATPRPWAVHCRLDEDAGTLVYHHPAFADDRHVCDCSFGSSIGAEENAANAALIVEAVNAYDTLRAESDRLRKIAHDLTDAITKVRPLGGSELFRRFDDQTYFADATYCGAAIEEMKRELHEARKDAVRAKRQAALSEAQP